MSPKEKMLKLTPWVLCLWLAGWASDRKQSDVPLCIMIAKKTTKDKAPDCVSRDDTPSAYPSTKACTVSPIDSGYARCKLEEGVFRNICQVDACESGSAIPSSRSSSSSAISKWTSSTSVRISRGNRGRACGDIYSSTRNMNANPKSMHDAIL